MGALTEMISSSGSLITSGVALFLLWQGQQDRRESRQEKKREQAAKVTCWCEWNEESPFATYDEPNVPAIFVRNSSDQAVYAAFLDYYHPQRGPERLDIGAVPPGGTRHLDIEAEVSDIPRWEPSALLPRLSFSDAGGRDWVRTVTGRLVVDGPRAGTD
jgi:hypothetical protein